MVRRAIIGCAAGFVTLAGSSCDVAGEVETTGSGGVVSVGEVARVIDGDTLEVDRPGGETVTVRVIGIDTPETVAPGEPVECYGPEASQAAQDLLAGEEVQLIHDPTQGRRDRYGRLLAYVTLTKSERDVGAVMLRRGHAREATYADPYQHQNRYRRLEASARDADRGLWEECT